jgi:hypothetical protein
MRKIRSLVLGTVSATAAATLFGASPANAAIVLCYYNGPNSPACPATTANVNVDTVTGLVVTGWLNDNHALTLGFTGVEELVGDGSGQATVGSTDDLLDTAVRFQLDGGRTFNVITWNLEPLSGNEPADEATSVQVSYVPAGANSPITYTLSGNGQNFWGLYGDAGEAITSITWGPYFPEGNGIDSIRQVRVGGVREGDLTPTPFGTVPEPSGWALLLVGFGAIGATLRTKKAKAGQRLRVA